MVRVDESASGAETQGRHAAASFTVVWDARVAESIMMLFLLLVCQDGGTVLIDVLVVGRSTLNGREEADRGRTAYWMR